jgi:uncharacterized membrane protein
VLQPLVHNSSDSVLERPIAVDPGRSDRAEPDHRSWLRRHVLPLSLAAGAFLVYALYSVLEYREGAEPSWDLAIFTQIVQNYAHFHAPIADIRGPQLDALGDHFSPILALLAPFYRIFPSPATLQVAQAALFAVAIVPITRTAIDRLGRNAGAAIGVSYALAWGIQSAMAVDFHEIAFAVPMLAFCLEALLNQRWRRAMCWALPLVLVKEDMGLTVAAIGLYMVICHQGRRGWSLIVAGVAATAVTIGVIIPALNPVHHYTYWGMLNRSGTGGIVTVVKQFFEPETKLHTVILLIVVSGIISLRSPLMVICLPTLAWRFFSRDAFYWGTDWHYNAVLMPVIFLAMIDGISKTKGSDPAWLRSFTRYVPAFSLAISAVLCVGFPLHDLFRSATYQGPPADVNAAIAAVPSGSSVESLTTLGLMTRLVPHHTVYTLGHSGGVAPQYIVLDTTVGGPAIGPPVEWADSLAPGATYTVVFSEGSYRVLKRTSPS